MYEPGEIYWIDCEGPGRLAIVDRPLGDDTLENEILAWRQAGIDVVVSLLTEYENSYCGLVQEAELCRSNGIQFISFPITDRSFPKSTEETLELVSKLNDLLTNEKSIGFHCYGCVGRAPLIASCVLMFRGETADRAFKLVGYARGYPIPEAAVQAEWGRDFARRLSLLV